MPKKTIWGAGTLAGAWRELGVDIDTLQVIGVFREEDEVTEAPVCDLEMMIEEELGQLPEDELDWSAFEDWQQENRDRSEGRLVLDEVKFGSIQVINPHRE